MALVSNEEIEQEVDEEYIRMMRFELEQNLRREIVNWGAAREFKFHQAVISAEKGAWDDVKKDLRRNRISLNEANEIVEKCLEFKLINKGQAFWYKNQFLQICSHENAAQQAFAADGASTVFVEVG